MIRDKFKQFLNLHFYLIVFADMGLFLVSLVGAYLIRFDFSLEQQYVSQLLTLLPFILPFKVIVFALLGLYRGMWRYTSIADLYRLTKATAICGVSIPAFLLFYYRFEGFARGVFFLDPILTLTLTGGIRLLIRFIYQKGFFQTGREKGKKFTGRKKRVIIVGAGDAAEKTYREIYSNPDIKFHVVAFVDDDTSKYGRSIHGVPVVGKIDDLTTLVDKLVIDQLIIAVPSATGEQMRKIVEVCENTSLPFKTLPGLGELIDGRVTVKDLRDVDYADLLAREPVELDREEISEYIHNKVVLVTGPGGSIGSELCRQIIEHNPLKLLLFDSSEANLYDIQMELQHKVQFLEYIPVLGAVQRKDLTQLVFETCRPQVVFHAAAYKHVPLLEENPWQAVWNNVLGTQNLMEAAVEHDVERFILVSTDKAVRPTNVMGASKRCCERLMYAYSGGETNFMAVRFGNVVGSAGSVVPLFRKQIAMGGPVTVTHPEMTRYFMTIPEAAQLILQAGALGEGEEIFILEMGTPVKIADMAKDLIKLSGKEPGRDIEIVYGKKRPGEKLFEELITEDEGVQNTAHDKIKMIKVNGAYGCFENKEQYRKWLFNNINGLYNAADSCKADQIKLSLKTLVPEYKMHKCNCVLTSMDS